MKVLFVGEGPNDMGLASYPPAPRPAAGTIATLAQKVCPVIAPESIALGWGELSRFNRDARKQGYEFKIGAAVEIASRHDCGGTVCVADRDRDETRLHKMRQAMDEALQRRPGHQGVCGLAIESIEAWTLGDPKAIAEALGVEEGSLPHYKAAKVEELYQRSGKPENKPKQLLDEICNIKHLKDCTEFRESVAAATDLERLKKNCPSGFKPFAEKLQAVFGPPKG